MPAPFEAPVTDPYGFRWRGLLCITTPLSGTPHAARERGIRGTLAPQRPR